MDDIKSENPSNENAEKLSVGYVRVLHAVPVAPNVDVYANEKLIANNIAFGEFTSYIPVPEETYQISIYLAGTKESPIVSNLLFVNRNTALTIATIGVLKEISLVAISDGDVPIDPSKAMIRFVHLSPNAPPVDITLSDGTIIFRDISFRHLTLYMEVAPANYTLEVRRSGTDNVVLTVPNVDLEANNFYSIYAVGLVSVNPELEALLLLDKNINT